jgi:hypothetical protein
MSYESNANIISSKQSVLNYKLLKPSSSDKSDLLPTINPKSYPQPFFSLLIIR